MAHEVVPSPHRNLAHLRLFDDLQPEDMLCDAELGLGTGKPVFILIDATRMNPRLPEGFLEQARSSFLVHPDTQHLALVVHSGLLKSVALMAVKLTGRRDRFSLHETVAAAENHLMRLIRQHGL